MTLSEYQENVKKLQEVIAALSNELETILTKDKVKAASARARLKSNALTKALKEFRKISLEYSKTN